MKTWIAWMTLPLAAACGADLNECGDGPGTAVCSLDIVSSGRPEWVQGGRRVELEVTATVPHLRPTDGLDVLLIADGGRLNDAEAGLPLEVRAVLSDAASTDTRTARVSYVQPFCRAHVVLGIADTVQAEYSAALAPRPSVVLDVESLGFGLHEVTVTVNPGDLELGPAVARLHASRGRWGGEEVDTSSVTLNLVRFDDSERRRASTTLSVTGSAVFLSAQTLGVGTERSFFPDFDLTQSSTSAICPL